MTTHIAQDASVIRTMMRQTEAQADEMMISLAMLKTKLVAARSNPELAPHIGQKALLRLARAEQQILAASTDLFRTHDELSKLAILMNVEHPSPESGFSEADPVGASLEMAVEA